MHRRRYLQTVGSTIAGTALVGTASGQDIDPLTYIAHRGFADRYTQNTIAAIEGAASDGADSIELDVRPCAGGELVVFHDSNLDYKTDLTGRVDQTPVGEVLRAEVLDSGATIPTLTDAIAAVPSSIDVIVELKSAGQEAWLPVVRRALETITDAAVDSRIIHVSSFHEGALAAVAETAPGQSLVALPGGDVEHGLELASTYDCAAISVPAWAVTSQLATRLHDRGVLLSAYTANTRAEVRELQQYDIDWISCDHPDALPNPLTVLGDRGAADLDGDGRREDIDGDGDTDVVDVQALFANRESDAVRNNPDQFDFDGSGGASVDVVDVQALFAQYT